MRSVAIELGMRLLGFKGRKNERRRFVIVTRERSGSYHLARMLDSAEDIVCHGEIFKPERVELRRPYLRQLGLAGEDTEKRDADPLDFVHRLTALNVRRHFGFKAFYWHLTDRPALMDEILLSSEWRKLFLFRNPLECYVSMRRALLTGRWILREKIQTPVSESVLNQQVTHTAESFDESIAQWRQLGEQYRLATVATPELVFRIDYDELGTTRTVQKALEFLGSSTAAADLASGLVKQYTGRFRDGVANWDDLEAHARRLGLERYLEGLAD